MQNSEEEKIKWKDTPKEEQLLHITLFKEKWDLIMRRVDETLKSIYEIEPLIKEHYALNLDHVIIWQNIFDEMPVQDIMKINEDTLILLVRDFAQNKRDKWLKAFLSKEIVESKKLTINQIALKFCYEGKSITSTSGNEIAKEYNHTSGHKLYLRFNHYFNRTNRINRENTPTKTINKIKLIESIIPILDKSSRDRAIDELNTLKSRSDTEY